MGESLRQMADVKYSLDDNIKQNFLEPLHHLQTKDLKEVMVSAALSARACNELSLSLSPMETSIDLLFYFYINFLEFPHTASP